MFAIVSGKWKTSRPFKEDLPNSEPLAPKYHDRYYLSHKASLLPLDYCLKIDLQLLITLLLFNWHKSNTCKFVVIFMVLCSIFLTYAGTIHFYLNWFKFAKSIIIKQSHMKNFYYFVMLLGGLTAFSQNRYRNGDRHRPLVGNSRANVVESGTNNGAVTDFDGKFYINCKFQLWPLGFGLIQETDRFIPNQWQFQSGTVWVDGWCQHPFRGSNRVCRSDWLWLKPPNTCKAVSTIKAEEIRSKNRW